MTHRPLSPQALQLLAIDAFLEMARGGCDSAGATSLLRSASNLGDDMAPSALHVMREQLDAVCLVHQYRAEALQKRR